MKLIKIDHPSGRCDGVTCQSRSISTWINLDEVNEVVENDKYLIITMTNGVFYQLHGPAARLVGKPLKIGKKKRWIFGYNPYEGED